MSMFSQRVEKWYRFTDAVTGNTHVVAHNHITRISETNGGVFVCILGGDDVLVEGTLESVLHTVGLKFGDDEI